MSERRIELLKYLKIQKMIHVRVGLPAEFYNNVKIFLTLCAGNGLNLSKMFMFMFGIGYEMVLHFLKRGSYTSVNEMIITTRYMRDMFEEVIQYQGKEWFMDAKSFKAIIAACKKHKVEPDELFDYIDSNRGAMLGEHKLLMTAGKVEAMVEYFVKQRN